MKTITRRRNSDNRYQRECDDMVDIATFLDERKALNLLPRYEFHYAIFPVSSSGQGRYAFAIAQLVSIQEKITPTQNLFYKFNKANQGSI